MPGDEYERRLDALHRLLAQMETEYPVALWEGAYDTAAFAEISQGLAAEPEGGARCRACFSLRLSRAAKMAAEKEFAWFCTTLTLSPHKNAVWINAIGQAEAAKSGVHFLPSDFKKRNGYKRSIELSKQYGLYRQDYCGCLFSRAGRAQAR